MGFTGLWRVPDAGLSVRGRGGKRRTQETGMQLVFDRVANYTDKVINFTSVRGRVLAGWFDPPPSGERVGRAWGGSVGGGGAHPGLHARPRCGFSF
jgi:hypothetical protein